MNPTQNYSAHGNIAVDTVHSGKVRNKFDDIRFVQVRGKKQKRKKLQFRINSHKNP